MADNTWPEGAGYLTSAAAAKKTDLAAEIGYVVAHGGPGPWGLSARLIGLRLRGIRLTLKEYLAHALWRRGIAPADLRAFLPNRDNRALNLSLRDRRLPQLDAMMDDKVAALAFLAARGLTVAPVAATWRHGSGAATDLTGIAELEAWLQAAEGPIFGKPVRASWSRGAFATDGPGRPGHLRMADGREAPVAALAQEIATAPDGAYMFQPRLRNAAKLRRHLGSATGSTRIVTLFGPDGPEVLYAAQKCPAPGSMHDGPSRVSRAWALVDADSGQVLRLRRLDDPAGPDLTHWQNPEEPLVGLHLPHFAAARAAVLAGHAALPGHGILGWDVFLSDSGPCLSEVNANPVHVVWQQATLSGFLTPDFARRIRARQAAVA